jgi:hypothetical protein
MALGKLHPASWLPADGSFLLEAPSRSAQAGLLAPGHPTPAPSQTFRSSGLVRFRFQLQRRDRPRFTRGSLFSPLGHLSWKPLMTRSRGLSRIAQSASIGAGLEESTSPVAVALPPWFRRIPPRRPLRALRCPKRLLSSSRRPRRRASSPSRIAVERLECPHAARS